MNWYAIETTPNAFRPNVTLRRELANLKTGRTELVRVRDPDTWLIEASLSKAGVDFYIPVERREIEHHRTKAKLAKRFPLITRVAFVANVTDWQMVEELDGVQGVIRSVQLTPIRIPERSIEALRGMEEEIRLARIAEAEAANMTREKLAERFPAGTRVRIKAGPLAGMTANAIAVTKKNEIRIMVEGLLGRNIDTAAPFDLLEKVA
jgi:transcription antitermination factor NusG